ncbi:MAG: cytochrome c peroxidase [Kofleriaceae bacterium]
MAWTRLLIVAPFVACTTSTVDDSADSVASQKAAALSSKEQLGQVLFDDKNLSEPKGEACSSCHDPKKAFAGDAKSKIDGVSAGAVKNVVGTRNAPTAMYAMYIPPFHFEDDGTPVGGQFWDGRADSLAEQAKMPFVNPREMNNASAAQVVAKVRAAKYADQVRAVYGAAALDDDTAAFDHIADAISAFEQSATFRPFNSDFDAYLRGEKALTAQQQRGFALFQDPDKGNCISCHVGDPSSHEPSDWLFTDHTYDTLGVPRNTAIPDNMDPSYFDLGLCQAPDIATKVPDGVTVASLCGAFKVPTLRNVAITGPYFHNGRFDELRDVVKFYVTRDTNPELWYPAGQKFDDLTPEAQANVNQVEVPYDRLPGEAPHLTDAEIDDVVAFLGSLTDK